MWTADYQLKLLSFGAIGVTLSLFFGYIFSLFLISADFIYLLISVILAIIFLAVFLLQVLIFKKFRNAAFLTALEVAAMVLPILRQPPKLFWLTALGTFLILLWSYGRGRSGLANMIKISFSKLRFLVLVFASFSILVFMIGNYIGSVALQEFQISRDAFSLIVKPLEPIIGRFLPGFSSKQSVNEVFGSFVRQAYSKELGNLPPEQQSLLIEQGVSQLKQSIEDAVNVRIRLNEDVIGAAYGIANSSLNLVPEQLRGVLLISLGFLIFFLVSSGTFVINIIAAFLAWLLYRLLLATNFIYISYKDVSKEVISL